MLLDFPGGIITLAMLVGFLLILIGVYPSKLRENSSNLLKHGLFSSIATIVSIIVILAGMGPVFLQVVGAASFASFFQFPVMWLHTVLGSLSIGLAVVMVALWVKAPMSELGCASAWRLMKPVIAIWAATITIGIIIYVIGLM